VILSVALLAPSGSRADDWPCWRGPSRNGVFGRDRMGAVGCRDAPNRLAGAGGRGVFLVRRREGPGLYVGYADDADTVVCLDANSGQTLWKHTYPSELGDKFFEGGTTGTPTVDGDHVYTLSRWGDVFCLDAVTGKVVWSTNIQKEHGVRVPGGVLAARRSCTRTSGSQRR
jgi:outer membrane protein assembly factor BamB